MRIIVLCLLACVSGYAEAPAAVLLADKTLGRVRSIAERTNGVLGFCAIDLTTGERFAENPDTVFAQASSIKIPLMMQVFASMAGGKLTPDQKFTIQPSDVVGGSGHLKSLLGSGPITLTLHDLITAMIETSDNTATNKLIALVGMDSVNRMLDTLGLKQTRLQRIMLDSAAARRGDENVSTPCEMARLAELIYRGKAVDPGSSRRMIEIMKLVKADFRAAIPASVPVASKPGAVQGIRCETGIVFLERRPFVMSVASAFLDDANNPVKDVARVLFEHYAKLADFNRYGHKTY